MLRFSPIRIWPLHVGSLAQRLTRPLLSIVTEQLPLPPQNQNVFCELCYLNTEEPKPRHAASLSAAVRNFNPKDNLPGAVNVGFADNYAESARLERLWELIWHKEWVAPAKRPGK